MWFEVSMLALVLVISLMSVALEEYTARNDPSLAHVTSQDESAR
jgi:hypothetical protein